MRDPRWDSARSQANRRSVPNNKWMKKIAILLLAASVLFSQPGIAGSQQLETPSSCANAGTQMQLNACSQAAANAAQAEENSLYLSIVAIARTTPGAAQKVQRAETLWRQYRSAYIDATWPKAHTNDNYGSILPLLVNEMSTDLTRKHIADLTRLLAVYKNPGYFMCASNC